VLILSKTHNYSVEMYIAEVRIFCGIALCTSWHSAFARGSIQAPL
jgi:hypothetical protein